MKKKFLLITITATLCFSLMGCSSQTEPASNSISEPVEKSNVEKELRHDFDPDKNQEESFHGFTYQVPITWTKRNVEASNEDTIYYYPDDGMLMVSYSENSGTIEDDASQEQFINGLKSACDNFSKIDRYNTTVLGTVPALFVSYSGTFSETFCTCYTTVFSFDNGIIVFTYSDFDSSAYDRSKDYEQIIKSLELTTDGNSFENPSSFSDIAFDVSIEDAVQTLNFVRNTAELMPLTDQGLHELEDGTFSQVLYGTSATGNYVSYTFISNSNKQVTTAHTSATDFNDFAASITYANLALGIDTGNYEIFSQNLGLSDENFKDNIYESDDGISYFIFHSGDNLEYTVQLKN